MVDILTQVKFVHSYILYLGITQIYGGYVFQESRQKYDWFTANRDCDLPGTGELCEDGICDATRLRHLLAPGTSQNITTWVRIHYKINETSKMRQGCYVYYKNYNELKNMGTFIKDNSPEKCSNVCGFGSQVFYLLDEYCFCTHAFDQITKQNPETAKNQLACSAKCKGSNSFFCGGTIQSIDEHNFPVYLSRYSLDITDPNRSSNSRKNSSYCVYAAANTDNFKVGKNCMRKMTCLKRRNITKAQQQASIKLTKSLYLTSDDDKNLLRGHIVRETTLGSRIGEEEGVSAATHVGSFNSRHDILLTTYSTERPTTTHAYDILTMLQTSAFDLLKLRNSTDQLQRGTRISEDSEIGIYVGAAMAFICIICVIVIIILVIKRRKQKSKPSEIETVYRSVPNDEANVSLLPSPTSNVDRQTRLQSNLHHSEALQNENDGQYDHLDRSGRQHRSETTGIGNTYDHADVPTQEVTYGYSRTDRNRTASSVDGDDVYDHTNDKVYNETGKVRHEDSDDQTYYYEVTGKKKCEESESKSDVTKDKDSDDREINS